MELRDVPGPVVGSVGFAPLRCRGGDAALGALALAGGRGRHPRGPALRLPFAHLVHTLILASQGDFKLNVQDQRSVPNYWQ